MKLAIIFKAPKRSVQKFLTILKDSFTSMLMAIKSISPFGLSARFRSDWKTLRHAALDGNYEDNKTNLPSLTKSINGRIFAALIFSDVCAYAAAPLGATVQIATNDWRLGLLTGIVSAYAIAVGSFQAAYAFACSDMYRRNTSSTRDFIRKLEKDLFPIHKKCFYAAAASNLVAIPICIAIAKLISLLPESQHNLLPISFIEMALAITIFDGLFVKSMSKFNEQYSRTLAQRYLMKNSD